MKEVKFLLCATLYSIWSENLVKWRILEVEAKLYCLEILFSWQLLSCASVFLVSCLRRYSSQWREKENAAISPSLLLGTLIFFKKAQFPEGSTAVRAPEFLVPRTILHPHLPAVLRAELRKKGGQWMRGPAAICSVGELGKMGWKHPCYISASLAQLSFTRQRITVWAICIQIRLRWDLEPCTQNAPQTFSRAPLNLEE